MNEWIEHWSVITNQHFQNALWIDNDFIEYSSLQAK